MYYMSRLRFNPNSDQAAFEAWKSEGTIYKAYLKLQKDGIISSKGHVFSPDGVRKAAVRYMVYHYDEAKPMLMEIYARSGYVVEEDYIERLLVKMAVSALRNPLRIQQWLLDHDLLEKHQKFIGSLIALPSNDQLHS